MNFDLSQSYFQLFALPASFEIDQAQLSTSFRELQKELHPDRFTAADDQAQRLSVQASAYVNEAYATLKDAVKRAKYLLFIKGVDLDEDHDTTVDAEFLMEQMVLREQLEEISGQDDPLDALGELSSQVKTRMTELSNDFAADYAADDLSQARDNVRKLLFLNRLQQQVHELEIKLEDELD